MFQINSLNIKVESTCNSSRKIKTPNDIKQVMKSTNTGKPVELSADHPLYSITAHSFTILDCVTN